MRVAKTGLGCGLGKRIISQVAVLSHRRCGAMIARLPNLTDHARWRVRTTVAWLTVCMSAVVAGQANAGLLAFPGAEGFGAAAVGGRHGRIIRVTNLNASGPGSLQAACDTEGPRTVVFTVAGVIRGDVRIPHSQITIAGQSAPAPGITIEGRLLARPPEGQRLHDLVVRFLRFRPPPARGHGGDVIQLPLADRVMLDHLSLAWGNDEMIDIIYSSDVTVQWSTVEESDIEGHGKGRPHNFALLSAYPGSGNVSIHHNLFAHHSRRLPSLAPGEEGRPADFRNNVVFNFRDGLSDEGHRPRSAINIVGNYYKRGPNAAQILLFRFHPQGAYYVADNYVAPHGLIGDPREAGSRWPRWLRVAGTGARLSSPVSVPAVLTTSAEEAYRQVMAQAGAFPRDRVTVRTIEEVQNGTGRWGRRAPARPDDGWFLAGLPAEPALPDTDGDGMPDAWEESNGLDKRDPSDHRRLMPSGYTAIETYLHIRAQELLQGAI